MIINISLAAVLSLITAYAAYTILYLGLVLR